MPRQTIERRSLPAAPHDSCSLSHSQNFITDAQLIARLLSRVELGQATTVIEIGAGHGALTAALAKLAPRVIAIEADTRLVYGLLSRFAACPRITLVHGDFLDYPLPARPFVVVANIPFNRTAEIVRKLTGEESGLQAAYLIMQREAARKFCGLPACGSPLLSHFLKLDYSVEYLFDIPRSCFSPLPSVDAAFALFRKRKIPLLDDAEAHQFRDLLSCVFVLSRPALHDALGAVFSHAQVKLLFHALRLQSGVRLSAVAFADWLRIYRIFAEHGSPAAHARIKGAYARLLREQAALSKRHRTIREQPHASQ